MFFSFSICVAITLFSAALALGQNENWEKWLSDFERVVGEKIAEAIKENDYKPLEEVDKLLRKHLSSPEQVIQKNWTQMGERLTRIKLEVLQSAFALRDKEFDPAQFPVATMHVMPPLGSAPYVYPDMPLEKIADPEAREKYKRAIAENERIAEKRDRELVLGRLCASYLNRCHTDVANAEYEGPVALARYVALVNETIRDDGLRKSILAGVKTAGAKTESVSGDGTNAAPASSGGPVRKTPPKGGTERSVPPAAAAPAGSTPSGTSIKPFAFYGPGLGAVLLGLLFLVAVRKSRKKT